MHLEYSFNNAFFFPSKATNILLVRVSSQIYFDKGIGSKMLISIINLSFSCLAHLDSALTNITTSCFEKVEKLFGERRENDKGNMGESMDILCYGLGNYTSCLIARYQMSLLMALRSHYKV